MTTTNRLDEKHRLTDLRHPTRRCIVGARADDEEVQLPSPGLRLGESEDGGAGSSGDAST
jgi:hypothetical protein